MAHPSKIKIGIIDSIKIDNYQYLKPTIEVEVVLNVGDDFQSSINMAKDQIELAMKNWKAEITSKQPKKK